MANTILGIDLGSYSVKVARLEAGFRNVQLLGLYEQRVPPAAVVVSGELGGDAVAVTESGESIAASLEVTDPGRAATGSGSDVSPVAVPEAESLLDRQLRALSSLLGDLKLRGESSAFALGEEVTLRMIELPLSDPKKVEQALPYELAGQLMTDLDEQVVSQTVARPGRSLRATSGGDGDAGSLWVAACAPRQLVQERLFVLSRLGLDPRLCGSTALATAALFDESQKPRRGAKAPETGGPDYMPPQWPIWILDLGHRATHVCAVAPHPTRSGQVMTTFARSIARGGQHLTQAIARVTGQSFESAERWKHDFGLFGSADPKAQQALADAVRALVRDLRQTLSAFVAQHGQPPGCIYACGGTSQLTGIQSHLESELGVKVMPLLPPRHAPWLQQAQREMQQQLGGPTAMSLSGASGGAWGAVSGTSWGPTPNEEVLRGRRLGLQLLQNFHSGGVAVGLSLALALPAPQVNFRKGELAYRTDYAFLREKARYLGAISVAVLLCIGAWAWAQMHVLEKESERLRQQLAAETTALFGEPRSDGSKVSAELASVIANEKGGAAGIPTTSALDLLDDISHAAPRETKAGKGRLDVVELHIRPKKTDLKATAASVQYVDDLAAALAKITCFKSITKGTVLNVRNTGPDGKPIDVKQFKMEITTTCP